MAKLSTLTRLLMATAAAVLLSGGVPRLAGAQATGTTSNSEIASKRVSLNLENADIRYALKLLFSSVGANFSLDQGVQGSITVSLTDVPFSTALTSILKSSSMVPLTYRNENGIYQVSVREDNTTIEPATTTTETTDTSASTKKYRPVRIQVMYANSSMIAWALGGTIIPNLDNISQSGGGYGGGYGGNYGGGFGNGFGGGGFGNSMNNGYGNNGFGNNSFGNNGFGNNSFGNNNFGGGFGNSFGGFGGNNFGGGFGGGGIFR